MDNRTLSTIAVSVAVIAAAIAAIVVSINRADAARAAAEYEAALADQTEAEERNSAHLVTITNAAARIAEDNRKAAEIKKADQDREIAALKEEIDEQKETISIKSRENKKIAEALLEIARRTNEMARASADAVRKARKMEDDLTQEGEDRVKAQREAREMRARAVAAEKELRDLRTEYAKEMGAIRAWKIDLEDRERALMSEKTIADLNWAGGMEDSVFDADGKVTKQVKVVYDPEKDMSLPEASRSLAKIQRIVREEHDAQAIKARDAFIKSIEKLYASAVKDGRVIDADFYRKSILSICPDWKPKDEEKVGK